MGIFLFFLKEKLKSINKKKAFFLLTLISLFILLPLKIIQGGIIPGEDLAASIAGAILDAILEATMTGLWFVILLQIIMSLSNFLVGLGGALLNWALALNTTVPLTHGPIVDMGWALARDLANMFFILALVMIAFATILGIESYGMRRFLVPLILIAILINFSQVLIGAAVDFTSVFMSIFAKKVSDWGSLVDRGLKMQLDVLIASVVVLGTIIAALICPYVFLPLALVGVNPIEIVATSLFKIIIFVAINVLLAVILLILAGIFLLRIPMIWVLTMIAPMMLVCYLFPYLRDKYKWWTSQLSEWIMIGIFTLFFLYIGMGVWDFIWSEDWRTQWDTARFEESAAFAGLDARWFANEILPYLVFILFLYIALHFAQKTNAIFAAAVIGAGMALGARFKGWAKKRAKKVPTWVKERALPPEKAERRARLMERVPGLRGRAEKLREETQKRTKGYIEEGEKKGKMVTPKEAGGMIARNALGDPFKNLGLYRAHAESSEEVRAGMREAGWSDEKIEKWLSESLTLARRFDDPTLKEIVKRDPRVAVLPAVRERVKAPTRIREVISAREEAAMRAAAPTDPHVAEKAATVRLWIKEQMRVGDWRDMEAAAVKGVEGRVVRDAILKEAKYDDFRRLGRDNPKARDEIQKQINDYARRPGGLYRYARRIYRMAEHPDRRRRLEERGWKFPGVPVRP